MKKLQKFIPIILMLVVIGGALGSCTGVGDPKGDGYPYHHMERGFRNPPNSIATIDQFSDRMKFFSRMISSQLIGAQPPLPENHILPRETALSQLAQWSDQDSISWIGHASFLIKLDGVTVLTDPIFSKRASPVSFAGPARVPPLGLEISDLPPIDVVVISHAHYDHLDTRTLDKLPNPERITAIVPLGLGTYFTQRNYGKVYEVDWYDEVTLPSKTGEFKLTAYPAAHWSSRSLFDRNRTLWMSYGFSAGGRSVYHTGDTETHPDIFKSIGAHMKTQHQGCDIGLISVGAYEPQAIMRGHHTIPEGGVQIGRDVGCAMMVPMHWGTFRLSFEPFAEPRARFKKAAGSQSVVMKIGETRPLKNIHNSSK